jgi:glutamyl-tRNA synthetase
MGMSTPARVRFAPSPTGYLHIGSIRSGLFNYLWAHHTGGKFVLRIEDTDRARLVPDAIDQITQSLVSLGIPPDEGPTQGGAFGPYIQSERMDTYHEYAERLLASGHLYRCWCSPERLADLRTAAQKAGHAFKYDRYCLNPANFKSLEAVHVLRFKIPQTPATISWIDAVRGTMEFKISELDDFVAMKSDGYPTYHFANVIDDHLMEITHVLRADEWLPSTPKHLLMFAAYGWQPPTYAHLPPVQGPDGKKKLSKRDGAQSVGEYIADGYLPEALMSFLASLGWNDGTTQEIYSPTELIEKFELERIQKSPAMFDKDRLTWINGKLIREMPIDQLIKRSKSFWPPEAATHPAQYQQRVLVLVQERLKFLAELPELTRFFFATPIIPPELLQKAVGSFTTKAEAQTGLNAVIDALEHLSSFEAETIERAASAVEEQITRDAAGARQNSRKQLYGLMRVLLTGQPSSPPLFQMVDVLGKDETLLRLKAAQL